MPETQEPSAGQQAFSPPDGEERYFLRGVFTGSIRHFPSGEEVGPTVSAEGVTTVGPSPIVCEGKTAPEPHDKQGAINDILRSQEAQDRFRDGGEKAYIDFVKKKIGELEESGAKERAQQPPPEAARPKVGIMEYLKGRPLMIEAGKKRGAIAGESKEKPPPKEAPTPEEGQEGVAAGLRHAIRIPIIQREPLREKEEKEAAPGGKPPEPSVTEPPKAEEPTPAEEAEKPCMPEESLIRPIAPPEGAEEIRTRPTEEVIVAPREEIKEPRAEAPPVEEPEPCAPPKAPSAQPFTAAKPAAQKLPEPERLSSDMEALKGLPYLQLTAARRSISTLSPRASVKKLNQARNEYVTTHDDALKQYATALRQRGYSEGEVNKAVKESLIEEAKNFEKALAEKRIELAKNRRIAEWWARWGEQGRKGALLKAAVMSGAGVVTGVAAATALGAVGAGALGGLATAGMAHSIARNIARGHIRKEANAPMVAQRDAAESIAAHREAFNTVPNIGALALKQLASEKNSRGKRKDKDPHSATGIMARRIDQETRGTVTHNRIRLGLATALGALTGLVAAPAGKYLHDWIDSAFGGVPTGGGGKPNLPGTVNPPSNTPSPTPSPTPPLSPSPSQPYYDQPSPPPSYDQSTPSEIPPTSYGGEGTGFTVPSGGGIIDQIKAYCCSLGQPITDQQAFGLLDKMYKQFGPRLVDGGRGVGDVYYACGDPYPRLGHSGQYHWLRGPEYVIRSYIGVT